MEIVIVTLPECGDKYPMNLSEMVCVGAGGFAAALDKRNGNLLWKTKLKGSFVTLLVDGSRVFAQAGGWLYCLDAASGNVLWINELPGLGYGLASLAVQGNSNAPVIAAAEEEAERQRQASQSS